MEPPSILKTEAIPLMHNLSRTLIKNQVVTFGTRDLPVKADYPYDELLPEFLQFLQKELASQNGHQPVKVRLVAPSYNGFSIDLGYYVKENKVPPEASDFAKKAPDRSQVAESFLKRIGGSPVLEKVSGDLPKDFNLDDFVRVYAEQVLYNSRQFRNSSLHYEEFDSTIEFSVSSRLGINPSQVRYLGQVMRGELVKVDYLAGKDYTSEDVGLLASTLLDRCGKRLNNRVNWTREYAEPSKPREPVRSPFMRKCMNLSIEKIKSLKSL